MHGMCVLVSHYHIKDHPDAREAPRATTSESLSPLCSLLRGMITLPPSRIDSKLNCFQTTEACSRTSPPPALPKYSPHNDYSDFFHTHLFGVHMTSYAGIEFKYTYNDRTDNDLHTGACVCVRGCVCMCHWCAIPRACRYFQSHICT